MPGLSLGDHAIPILLILKMSVLQEDIDLDEVDMMFEEAEESGDEEEVNDLKTILYDKNKKGFYVRQRKFEVADMRLLAECVYAAKFIAEGQVKRLVTSRILRIMSSKS